MNQEQINLYQIDLYLNQVINKILPMPNENVRHPPSLENILANPILIDFFLYNEVKSAYSNITDFPFQITYASGLDYLCNRIYVSSADIHKSVKNTTILYELLNIRLHYYKEPKYEDRFWTLLHGIVLNPMFLCLPDRIPNTTDNIIKFTLINHDILYIIVHLLSKYSMQWVNSFRIVNYDFIKELEYKLHEECISKRQNMIKVADKLNDDILANELSKTLSLNQSTKNQLDDLSKLFGNLFGNIKNYGNLTRYGTRTNNKPKFKAKNKNSAIKKK